MSTTRLQPLPGSSQTRRIRHVTEQSKQNIQANQNDESEPIEPESTLYLEELTEDWAYKFSPPNKVQLSKKHSN